MDLKISQINAFKAYLTQPDGEIIDHATFLTEAAARRFTAAGERTTTAKGSVAPRLILACDVALYQAAVRNECEWAVRS